MYTLHCFQIRPRLEREKKSAVHQFSFPHFGKKDKKHAAEKQTSPEAASYSVNEVVGVNMGNHFRNKLPESFVCLIRWDFFDWTGFDIAGQSRRVLVTSSF